jgi:hypothetical protein
VTNNPEPCKTSAKVTDLQSDFVGNSGSLPIFNVVKNLLHYHNDCFHTHATGDFKLCQDAFL